MDLLVPKRFQVVLLASPIGENLHKSFKKNFTVQEFFNVFSGLHAYFFNIAPPFPISIFFCESLSTTISAVIRTIGPPWSVLL